MGDDSALVERIDDVTVIEEDEEVEVYEGVALSPREIRFVNLYIDPTKANFSAEKAWMMLNNRPADWNGTGGKWVKKPHIARAILNRMEGETLTAETALRNLAEVAKAPFGDFIDVKTRGGEIVSVRMDLAAKVRANEIILRAYNRLDNGAQNQTAIVVNINTPGLKEDELA